MKNILMNTEMTKAILDGRKVQFREVLNDMYQNCYQIKKAVSGNFQCRELIGDEDIWMTEKPKYKNGDVLQVVEEYEMCMSDSSEDELFERDTNIFLKITNVRVEKLQDMHVQDIKKEGIQTLPPTDGYHSRFSNGKKIFIEPFPSFINLWNKTAPKGYKWDDNPYVFVYEFERINND